MNNFNSAFKEITKITNGIVSFREVDINENPDINIDCVDEIGVTYDSEYRYEDLGNSQNWVIEDKDIIAQTNITISKSVSSGWYPRTEIHEILHSFGFEHSDKPYHIMNHLTNTAEEYKWWIEDLGNPAIDSEIIKELIKMYSKRQG